MACGGVKGGVSRFVLMRLGLVGLQYFFLGHLIYPHINIGIYNIPRACLLDRSPVPAMDLKSIRI